MAKPAVARRIQREDSEDDLIGHNSNTPSVAADKLRMVVERIERLEEEKQVLADDIKDVYGEAKANGFDTKVLRKIIAIRKIDAEKRREQETVLEVYLEALGMA